MTINKILGMLVSTAVILTSAMTTVSASQASMRVVGKANPPIGHYEFCQMNPTECETTGRDAGPHQLTEQTWRAMLEINYDINTNITPLTDLEIYGVEERWAYPRSVGDCEDFALLKRKLLIDRGFSPSDLLMTVVLQPNGEGHAVLTVRTDRGDFVLDNMRNKVLLWSETEYTYLKRQSSTHAGRWVKLQDGRASIVGSVSSN